MLPAATRSQQAHRHHGRSSRANALLLAHLFATAARSTINDRLAAAPARSRRAGPTATSHGHGHQRTATPSAPPSARGTLLMTRRAPSPRCRPADAAHSAGERNDDPDAVFDSVTPSPSSINCRAAISPSKLDSATAMTSQVDNYAVSDRRTLLAVNLIAASPNFPVLIRSNLDGRYASTSPSPTTRDQCATLRTIL